MAQLSAQDIAVAGTSATYASASSSGDKTPVGSNLVAHVKNNGTSSITATVTTPGTVKGLAISDASVSVPASGDAFIPLRSIYRDPSSGMASITYSDAANAKIAVLKLP